VLVLGEAAGWRQQAQRYVDLRMGRSRVVLALPEDNARNVEIVFEGTTLETDGHERELILQPGRYRCKVSAKGQPLHTAEWVVQPGTRSVEVIDPRATRIEVQRLISEQAPTVTPPTEPVSAPSNAEIANVLKDAILVLNFSSETDNYNRDGAFFIKDYSGHGHDARLNSTHYLDGGGRAGTALRCTGGVGALLPARVIGDQAAFTLGLWVYRMRTDRFDEIYTESGQDNETPDVRVQIIPTNDGPRHNFLSGEVRDVELPGGEQVQRGAWGSPAKRRLPSNSNGRSWPGGMTPKSRMANGG
jgi:hypothetical protein